MYLCVNVYCVIFLGEWVGGLFFMEVFCFVRGIFFVWWLCMVMYGFVCVYV